jgi:hypothetical protein
MRNPTGNLMIPPAKGKKTANLIPNVRFQLIDGMGHDIPPVLGSRSPKLCSRISDRYKKQKY